MFGPVFCRQRLPPRHLGPRAQVDLTETECLVTPQNLGDRTETHRSHTHPGDDLEARLLLLVDLQSWDDFPQQVGHLLRGALLLLLRPSQSIKQVVGDLGEAAQRGDVRVLPELLQDKKRLLMPGAVVRSRRPEGRVT